MRCSEKHDCSDYVLFLEGEVTQTRADEIRAHLAVCQPCRDHLEQDKLIIEALSTDDAELERFDIAPAVLSAEREARRPAPRRFRLLSLYAGVAACLVILGAVFLFSDRSEYRVKGAPPAAFEQDRWVGLQVYQAPDGKPTRLGKELSPGTDLLFSYSNTGKTPFRYLMVFAIDSRGSVHWFYPAYQEPGTDPASIEISAGKRIELRERIHHKYAPGTLTIIGLFTRAPYRVTQIEAMAGKAGGARLPIEGSAQRVIMTRVMP